MKLTEIKVFFKIKRIPIADNLKTSVKCLIPFHKTVAFDIFHNVKTQDYIGKGA